MKQIAEKFKEGKKILKNFQYFAFTLFPLLKEKRILKKLLLDLSQCSCLLIETLLAYEAKYKRILKPDFDKNKFKLIGKRWLSEFQIDLLLRFKSINEKIKESKLELMKENKFLLVENKDWVISDLNELRKNYEELKSIYEKIQKKFEKDLLISKYLN